MSIIFTSRASKSVRKKTPLLNKKQKNKNIFQKPIDKQKVLWYYILVADKYNIYKPNNYGEVA